MYAGNTNDFWFDLPTMMKPTWWLVGAGFVAIAAGLGVVAFVGQKWKKKWLFPIVYGVAFAGFLVAYIHSNYLAGMLPSLDGVTIDWSGAKENIISVVVCLAVMAGVGVTIWKCKDESVKYFGYISLAVTVMLGAGLASTLLTKDLTPKEIIPVATEKNINLVSTKENYVVFLADAVDATHFNKVVESNEEYQETLKDFTFFPDTLSGYAFTRDSIPFIFSGVWNENQEPFKDYSTKAYDNSPLFNALKKKGYRRNFYSYDFTWQSSKALEFENLVAIDKKVKKKIFIKQELKYLLFKMLPYPLKRFSKIGSMNFNLAQADKEDNSFWWGDYEFYHDILEREVETTDDKVFSYYHIEGGHTPFQIDENVEEIDEEIGTYPQKLEATMKIFQKYVNRLKEAGVYDKTTIVLLADHGFWFEGTNRQNPILYVKAAGETHDEMMVSDKQVAYEDVAEMLVELLDGKNSQEIFAELPTDGRVRRYLYNGFQSEENMYEYEQTGKAWETETFNKTGREFNL